MSPPDQPLSEPSAPDRPAPAVGTVRRLWQQPLGDVHNKLANIVGPGSLELGFDCGDQDFVTAMLSHWPLNADFTRSLYEADTLKLAEALNGLVRLYAIETGQDRVHVLLEARRGKPELPGWWQGGAGGTEDRGAPVLIATYAFNTSFAEQGLFTDLNDAYAEMDLLAQPHRLLVALGPPSPILATASGSELMLDADEERLASLKRWNQKLSLQINQLLAEVFDTDEEALDKVREALAKVKSLSRHLSGQLKRRSRKLGAGTPDEAPLPARAGESLPDMPPTIAETVAGLKDALQSESLSGALSRAARAELQKSLDAIGISAEPKTAAPRPAKPQEKAAARPANKMASPASKLAVVLGLLLCCASFTARAKGSDGSFGLTPYKDTLRYYEYDCSESKRVSDGGNGRHTPGCPKQAAAATQESGPIEWETQKGDCADRAARAAKRRFGNKRIEVESDANEGTLTVSGKGSTTSRYTFRCEGDPKTGLLQFRPG